MRTFFFFIFLWPHLWHMGVPRLGVESELQLLAYATATVTMDLSLKCNLCCSLQCQILNPLSEARDGTHIFMDISLILFYFFLNYTCFTCFIYNDFYFFHDSWFTVFCQFSTVQHGDPVKHTCIPSFFSHYHAPS